ncbi:MAG: BTAD domain-containing putative transcriptional regulator [Frankiaceae bacterium]
MTRPRLLALLGERFERRLVLVVAGAGFGKSTLLAQAVAENQLDPRGVDVWLSCAQDDAAASQLAAGLLTALHADPAGAGDPGAAIAAAVWQRAPAEVALLLDDVHLLPTGSPGAALLAELPRALPANAHLVLAGRADPPVGWSRLAAAGEVREIREENLGFAAPEVAEFARLRDVPPALLAGVGGWPALAELTAATGQSRVADFLWEEILSAVPGPDRRLLAAIAAAGGADDEVASALAGRPVALTSLLAGLPLIAKGDGGWHRLHALWQPALIRELSPAEVADVRRTAGRVLHERGDMAAAARLYADAAAWDDLDRLIVDTCQITYPVVGNDVLGEWLRRLPPARRGEPTAVLLEGTLLRAVDPPAGQALLRRAAAGYRATDQLAGEIACLSRLAWIAWWQRDPEAIGNLQPRVVELASSSRVTGPAGDSLAALSAWAQLVGADVSGNTAGALALLESMTATRFSPDWQAVFDVYRGLQHLALGDPATALVFAERAVANAAVTAQQGNLSLALSCLQLMGRLDEVVARLPDMFAVPELVAQNRVAQNALAAVWLAWVGRPVQARKHLREAEQAGRGLSTPMTPVFLAAGRLAVALAEGDEAAGALAARLHRLCEGEPSMARLVDRAFLAVQYVLLPSTRTWWDAQPLAGCFAAARDLARTVVALRDGARPDRSRLPAPEVIRAFLPSTWVSELAAAGGSPAELVAAAGTGPPDALGAPVHIHLLGPVQLFRDGIPVTHPHLRRGRVRELLA